MEVILKSNIEKLGAKDEIVKVKPGYARNYLIPRGYAIAATGASRKMLAENLKQRAHKESKILAEAQATAAKLSGLEIKIGAKASETGKIFGSVNTIQLSEALSKAGFTIDRKSISISDEHIKMLGAYEAKVKLHKEVSAVVKFEVIAE
ncbi:MAG: 50S ribosomal protein L9 [Crocinitomicaceae bacterium]|nr:50S ribosomal protein L9 [Crocinitomicaceae bacterium]